MNLHASEVTKEQLIKQFNTVVADTEHLLSSVATAGSEKTGALRASLEQKLAAAKASLDAFQKATASTAQAAASSTDDYVHAHPWQAIGIAAGLTVVVAVATGFLLGRR